MISRKRQDWKTRLTGNDNTAGRDNRLEDKIRRDKTGRDGRPKDNTRRDTSGKTGRDDQKTRSEDLRPEDKTGRHKTGRDNQLEEILGYTRIRKVSNKRNTREGDGRKGGRKRKNPSK